MSSDLKLAFLFSLTILTFGCETEIPPSAQTITLSVQDVGVTDVWLRVALTNVNDPSTISIHRNGQEVLSFPIINSDTVFIDEDLLPGQAYKYQAIRLTTIEDASNEIQVSTLDSTSHDITWDIITLGDGNGSILQDVAILSDTLAYAVGEIYEMDSLGNWDSQVYNLLRWDGESWTPMRLQFYTICGQASQTPYPASSILAFAPTDIWIAMKGSQVARWNGSSQTATMCLPVSFSIEKLWGESPELCLCRRIWWYHSTL